MLRHSREALRHAFGDARLLVAHRRHDERPHRAERMREEGQEIERPEIGGVQVFDDPEHGALVRRPREGRGDAFPEREGVMAIRLEPERAEARRDGKVRGRVGELPRAPPRDHCSSRLRLARELGGDRRLAHPRLARDEDHLPASFEPGLERRAELLERCVATVELRSHGRLLSGGTVVHESPFTAQRRDATTLRNFPPFRIG